MKYTVDTHLYFKIQWKNSVYFRRDKTISPVYIVNNGTIQRCTNIDVENNNNGEFIVDLKLSDLFDVKDKPAKDYNKTTLELDELLKIMGKLLGKIKCECVLEELEYAFSEEVLIAEYIKKEGILTLKEELLNDVDRFVISVAKPVIERETGNFDEDTFDFIRVEVYLPANAYMDKNDIRDGVKKHYHGICKKALEKIQSDKSYQKYGVPVSMLKLSKMNLSFRTKSLELLFELKKTSTTSID